MEKKLTWSDIKVTVRVNISKFEEEISELSEEQWNTLSERVRKSFLDASREVEERAMLSTHFGGFSVNRIAWEACQRQASICHPSRNAITDEAIPVEGTIFEPRCNYALVENEHESLSEK